LMKLKKNNSAAEKGKGLLHMRASNLILDSFLLPTH